MLLMLAVTFVRTFTGAWIETSFQRVHTSTHAFAPSRVRGLKLKTPNIALTNAVRTFTGAWIETDNVIRLPVVFVFAPSRVRGLKP